VSADVREPIALAAARCARVAIAVLYRQAGLIALCVLAGAAISLLLSLRQPRVDVSTAPARVQTQLPSAPSAGDVHSMAGSGLKLDLDPGLAIAGDGSTLVSSRNEARRIDIDADRALPASRIAVLLGPLAGLSLGLLLAALRELGGDRMRSPGDAQRALGVPVLGAIPTLSAKARSGCFQPPMGVPDAAPMGLA
jgi:hypothetical protein